MDAWVAWAIAAVILAVGEIFTPGLFFLGPIALAAVAAALAAAAGLDVALQVLVFAGASLASLAVLRPLARAHLRQDGERLEAFLVVGDPVDHRVPVPAELVGTHVRRHAGSLP